MGKVGPPPTLHNRKGGYSGKTLVAEKCGTEHWRKNALFHEKLAFFWWGRFSCCVPVGPKRDSEKARPCGVCRAGSSLAAYLLGYTGKTLVWWEIGEKGPYSRYFSRVSCLFLLGSCGCKSDLERGTPNG